MAKAKTIEPGDTVYHVTAGEKKPGIVISTRLVEVDWGPDTGSSVHEEAVLSTTFTPDYGAKE